jgi:hypothetical protein
MGEDGRGEGKDRGCDGSARETRTGIRRGHGRFVAAGGAGGVGEALDRVSASALEAPEGWADVSHSIS